VEPAQQRRHQSLNAEGDIERYTVHGDGEVRFGNELAR
jgi:hypothetical protein